MSFATTYPEVGAVKRYESTLPPGNEPFNGEFPQGNGWPLSSVEMF
jgi:hypothetical protein